ncbi:hypothetical protein T4B_10026 [Trichinella pseudospiralis]|uniref:MULE transposase domain-containing protein n=1 Tax=Trichinella pseudospiralis TaxID=6337 RepID=A0A0V1HNH3_TRIPS|nr:hypothetical protein T4B_10026 [Trichinella pseudospiralis]
MFLVQERQHQNCFPSYHALTQGEPSSACERLTNSQGHNSCKIKYPLQLDHNSVTKGVACIMSTVGKGVGVVRQPQTVICNFETALISTVQARFKSVHIQGCYFYFCQTVLRKVAKLGMQIRYLH